MTKLNIWCKQCMKFFIDEELVKIHLQWRHNIPPYEAIQKMDELRKKFLE